MLMFRFVDGNIQSNMGNIMGVDATLTLTLKVICKVTKLRYFQHNLACHSRGESPAEEAYPIT